MGTPTTNKGYIVPTLNSDFNMWGSEVNGNYAIQDLNLGGAQSISVAGSSNVTATAPQAQYLLTVLTGILTGNIEYILPAVGGLYVIGNGTTGAFSLTLACAGGGTTVAIPQGQYMTVVCDGTNIVSATSAYVLNSASISVTAITATSGFIVPNSVAYQSKDSGGTIRSMLEYNASNSSLNFSGTNNWTVVKSDGSATYLSIDNTTGAAYFLEGVLFSLGFTVPNNQALLVKDSGGTTHTFFVMGTDNNSYMEVGPGGYWSVTTNGGASPLLQIENAGATFYGRVTAASLAISGAAAFATIPTGPTPASADSSTKLATTAFVNPASYIGNPGSRTNADGSIEKWGSFASLVGYSGGILFTVPFPTACDYCDVRFTNPNGYGYVLQIASYSTSVINFTMNYWSATGLGTACTIMWYARGR